MEINKSSVLFSSSDVEIERGGASGSSVSFDTSGMSDYSANVASSPKLTLSKNGKKIVVILFEMNLRVLLSDLIVLYV